MRAALVDIPDVRPSNPLRLPIPHVRTTLVTAPGTLNVQWLVVRSALSPLALDPSVLKMPL